MRRQIRKRLGRNNGGRQRAPVPPAEMPPTVERMSEERSMPQFITVATPDELAAEQAKLVEVEGQKIALFRVVGGFKCAGFGGARMRPSQLDALMQLDARIDDAEG